MDLKSQRGKTEPSLTETRYRRRRRLLRFSSSILMGLEGSGNLPSIGDLKKSYSLRRFITGA
ncbi:hypothetical protein DRO53_03220 [Candidatus Bathyarchaeota archaeon]|nr:MAG: hypothetical protein DRO46_00615 [Candidatus Hecatellales archaeon]RLI34590.1 MAG: hypothetical protein DRO53_03220 [Candidatus Bathyarchaeota archaeon]